MPQYCSHINAPHSQLNKPIEDDLLEICWEQEIRNYHYYLTCHQLRSREKFEPDRCPCWCTGAPCIENSDIIMQYNSLVMRIMPHYDA